MDRENFISIVKENHRLIYKVCYTYCKNSESRKDLEQEILIQLWKSLPRFDGRVKITTWIYKVALNTAFLFHRNESKYKENKVYIDKSVFSVDDNSVTTELEERIAKLYRFIDNLDELDKALMMLYLEGIKYKDIADILANKLRIDEEALRMVNLDRTKDQMEYPYISEMVELIGGALVGAAVVVMSFRLKEEPVYLLLGLIAVLVGLLYIKFALKKIGFLKQVNYYDTPVVKLQGELARIKKRILKLRKTELLLFPLYLLPLAALTSKTFYNVDVFGNVTLFAGKFAIALGVAYLLVLLIHKYLYDKRFKEVEKIIARLKEFEKDS